MKKIAAGIVGICSLLILTGCMSTQISQTAESTISSSLDIDQDGTEDLIEVYYQTPEQLYSDNDEKADNTYSPCIRVVISGNETVIPVQEPYIYDAAIQALTSDTRSPIILVTFDVGGALGNKTIYAVTVQDKKIKELPLPEIESGVFGYNFDITYLNMYEVTISCPQTGYSTQISRPQSSFEITTDGLDSIYDENGIVMYQPQIFIHRPSSVEVVEHNGRTCLSVKQSVSEIIDANVWGEITTFLTWDSDGNYEILEQQVTLLSSVE